MTHEEFTGVTFNDLDPSMTCLRWQTTKQQMSV